MTTIRHPNFERELEALGTRSACKVAFSRSRFGLNSKRAHPPIPPLRVRREFAATRELEARALQVRASSSSWHRYYQRENCQNGTWEQSPMATDFISRCRTRRGRHLAHDGRPRCAGSAGSPSRRQCAKDAPVGGVLAHFQSRPLTALTKGKDAT